MLINSIANARTNEPDSQLILRRSLQRTSACFSLDSAMPRQKDIDNIIRKKDRHLKNELQEIGYDKGQEHLQSYYQKGLEEIAQLTQYYKYYTQSSILYQPAFFKAMHSYRENRKAIEYNRLKVMLELSNSTQNDSSFTGNRLENTPMSSFRFLSLLKLTNPNEESLLLQKLKEKLQTDYGPNKYNSLEQIDKHYCFSKPIQRTFTIERIHTRGSSKKNTKQSNQHYTLLFKNKTNIFRSSSTAASGVNSARKQQKNKVTRKKHTSMDNFTFLSRQNNFKSLQSQGRPASREIQVKRKILGVKERIKKQKQLLIKKGEQSKTKKTILQGKIGRRMRQ